MKGIRKWRTVIYPDGAQKRTHRTRYQFAKQYPHRSYDRKLGKYRISEVAAGKTALMHTPYKMLVPTRKAVYKRYLHALDLLRHNPDLGEAASKSGLSIADIRRELKDTLVKKNGSWVAKPNDPYQRSWEVYAEGKRTVIITTNFRDASIIGRYWNAVGKYLESGDRSLLIPFRNVTIIDAEGSKHTLETDPKTLRKLDDMREDHESAPKYNQ